MIYCLAVIYNENGVKVTTFPAIHIRDGSVSFRLEWKGLSFVYGGDSVPNKWFAKEAKGADVVVHECFFTPEQWMRIAGFPYKQAYWVTTVIHTPPQGFGKLMSMVKPRLGEGAATRYKCPPCTGVARSWRCSDWRSWSPSGPEPTRSSSARR